MVSGRGGGGEGDVGGFLVIVMSWRLSFAPLLFAVFRACSPIICIGEKGDRDVTRCKSVWPVVGCCLVLSCLFSAGFVGVSRSALTLANEIDRVTSLAFFRSADRPPGWLTGWLAGCRDLFLDAGFCCFTLPHTHTHLSRVIM